MRIDDNDNTDVNNDVNNDFNNDVNNDFNNDVNDNDDDDDDMECGIVNLFHNRMTIENWLQVKD